MCNRLVQDDVVLKPGDRVKVLLKGPAGGFEVEFNGAVFAGPARSESRGYWKRQGAEECRVPGVSKFGEKSKVTGEQNWETVQSGSTLDGLVLPPEEGKQYRLLKVVTQPATPHQIAYLGNDRAPIVRVPVPVPEAQCKEPDMPHEWSKEIPTLDENGDPVGTDYTCGRCGMTVERYHALTGL